MTLELSEAQRPWPKAILAILIIAGLPCLSATSVVSHQSAEDQRAEARRIFEEGEQAYKSGHFDEAIESLKKAKELDPSLIDVRISLATAYAALCVPGSLSSESIEMCKHVIPEFKEALAREPQNLAAIDGLALILYKMAPMQSSSPRLDLNEMEESKSYRRRHIEIRPSDPEPYYWIAAIDEVIARDGEYEFHPTWSMNSRQPDDDQPLSEDARRKFAGKYRTIIAEGIEYSDKAISLRPEDYNALGCLGSLYWLKADTEPSAELRGADLEKSSQLARQSEGMKDNKAGPENLR
jgi:tetratricopeptide (TPR) repeat protein